ncbi:MAG: hypothetical protein ABFD52_07155 [Acidobacteriota bacterium]
MRAALPGVLLISVGMATSVAQTNAIQNQASERIDRTIVRKVDLTRDGRPEEIVLHVVGKDIKSPFSWTLEVLSRRKRIFYMTVKGDAASDGLFSQPWYQSDCNNYESCKREWYFSGILRTFLRPFNQDTSDQMSGKSPYPCTTYVDLRKMIVNTGKATLSEAQKIVDKLKLDMEKGRVVGIDLDVNPISYGRCAIWIPVIDDFVIIYYTD